MISLLSEHGVPESSRNFVKFGPHRMSTGELKTMYHANPTRILSHSHTQLLTHSRTHPLSYSHTQYSYSQTLEHTDTLAHSGGGRQEENECERSENPLAVWLRNVPVWLTEERRWAIGHQLILKWWCFDRVGRWLLFCQPGFTMRSNLGRTVTQATRTGSRTNKIIPGLEWGKLCCGRVFEN